jgi:hypothetical protein
LDHGVFRWRSVLGVSDKLIERGVSPTGAPNIGGSLVTAGGLVFIGATNDSRFRAFDKDTGDELWVTRLPASAHASPMTFRGPKSGRQFVVVAAGGGNKYSNTYSDTLIAFSLGDGPPSVEYSKTYRRDLSVPIAAAGAAQNVPEPFSHMRHAALKLPCAYCHTSALNGDRAGFPTASTCRTCHSGAATENPVIQRLAALPSSQPVTPAVPAYRLPDFVFFQHSRHAQSGVSCAVCHGDVYSQDRIRPVLAMKMKSCVDCHRARQAALSCTACHELSQ